MNQKIIRSNTLHSDSQQTSTQLWKKLKKAPIICHNQQKIKEVVENNSALDNQKSEVKIHQFLKRLHHKVSDSVNGSESEVVDKMSIDWEDDLGNHVIRLSAKTESFDGKCMLYTPRAIKSKNELIDLSEISTIDDLVELIQQCNTKLYRELSKLIDNHANLQLYCESLKCEKQKLESKVGQLSHQVQNLEKNNKQLNEDFKKLKSQVEIQISIEQERIKYKYEKMIQQLQAETQKKTQVLKMSQSTNGSTNTQLKQLACDPNSKSTNLGLTLTQRTREKPRTPTYASSTGNSKEQPPKRQKLSRSNKKQQGKTIASNHQISATKAKNQFVPAQCNQHHQQKARYIPGCMLKYNPVYDKILNQVIKQDHRKQMRSLRLASH